MLYSEKACFTMKPTYYCLGIYLLLIFQVQMLQEQVGHLAESQATTDDRYSKVKQENATLTQK